MIHDYLASINNPAAAFQPPVCYEGAVTDPCTGAIIADPTGQQANVPVHKRLWQGVICDCTPSCKVDELRMSNNNMTGMLDDPDVDLSPLQVFN